ncbi:unnamed protein product [Durusdinium trenchii]|uniref:EF-hand domain-containing protein n=1 Tax=Durusdinium trenchii TaxID=1381693 RepID=A0ABP0NZY3_9DINO
MDACLEEVRHVTREKRPSSRTSPKPTLPTSRLLQETRRLSDREESGPRISLASAISEQPGYMSSHVNVRNLDMQHAFKSYAKDISKDLAELDNRKSLYQLSEEDEKFKTILRPFRRTRLDLIWETLDDHNSSKSAWWISQLQSLLVIATVVFGTLEVTEDQLLDPVTVAIVETIFDSIFCLEFLFRIISAPSRCTYFADVVNWADMVCVLGLPLRASIGFVFQSPPASGAEEVIQVLLIFVLPLFRFLKLLRYFEISRLLVDACVKSAEAVPVLSYMMTLIVLVSATFIYLFEEKSNIPSMPHALWLAVVTMTTVGYGDFFPTSVGGYLTVSVLTFISVVFLALPVGIVGHEFNKSWQSRAHMLLMTRVRKCLNKWGFNAGDVQMLIQYADVDGDGQLTLGEFVELIRQMRIGVSSEAAAELFTLLDVDYNGYVDSEEFLRNVFPDEYVKEIQRAQFLALPECKKQIHSALVRLDSLRSAVGDPATGRPMTFHTPIDSEEDTNSKRSFKEEPLEEPEKLFHEPL